MSSRNTDSEERIEKDKKNNIKSKKILTILLIVLFSAITMVMYLLPNEKNEEEIITETRNALEKKYSQKFTFVDIKKQKKNEDVRLLNFKEKNSNPENESFLVLYYSKDKMLDYYQHILWKKEIQKDYQEKTMASFGATSYVIGLGTPDAEKTIKTKPESYKESKKNDFTLIVTVPEKYKNSKKTKEKIYKFGKSIPKPFYKLEVYYDGEKNDSTKISFDLRELKDKKTSKKELLNKIQVEQLEFEIPSK